MPAAITPPLVVVWFVVGLVTGLGWALAQVIVSKISK